MIYELLTISIIHALILISFFIFVRSRSEFKYTSPESLYIIFGVLHVLSQIYFSLDFEFFEIYVRADVQDSLKYIYSVAFLKIIIDFFYLISCLSCRTTLFARPFLSVLNILRLDIRSENLKPIKFLAFLLLVIGVFFTYKVIAYAGGIVHLWVNIGIRSSLFEGGGAYLSLSRNALQFSGFLFFVVNVKSGKLINGLFYVFVCIILLSLTGSRSSFIFLIFAVFLYYYSFLKPLKVSAKIIVVFMISVVVFSSLGKLRNFDRTSDVKVADYVSSAILEIPKQISPYVSQIRRDVVILKYFEAEPFWYGSQYYSLLTSVIPRNYYSDKPVLDGGRYVVGMHEGIRVGPIMKLDELPGTGWPEGNMAGYMNFGIIGLILFTIISAFLVKGVYLYSMRGSLSCFFIYSYVVFIAPVSFDPYGIFKFITYLVTIYFVGFLFLVIRALFNSTLYPRGNLNSL